MTVDEVLKTVEEIREIAGDDEVAHVREDDLHFAVLSAIAKGECNDPVGCATAALKTAEIDFARWCA